MRRNGNGSPWKAFFLVSAVGADFAVCVLVGYWLGSWLSRAFGGSPLWIVAGLFAGLFIGVVSVWKIMMPFMEDHNE